jgi:hypothetical protein
VTSANDWGCAKGFLVEELRDAGIDAVGYDVSDYAVSFARERGLPCHVADIRAAGLVRRVEATFVLGVLMYTPEQELPGVLANLRQSTSRYLLASSYYEGLPQDVPDPLRRITRPQAWWRQQFELAGFRFEREESAFEVYSA